MQVLIDLATGKIKPDDAAKLLNPVNERRDIAITRIKDKDGKDTPKIKISGLYSVYPVTLYAAHVVRLVDEGHWDKVVEMARIIVAEGETLTVDEPPQSKTPETAAEKVA